MDETVYHVYATDKNGVEKVVGSYKTYSPFKAKQLARESINKTYKYIKTNPLTIGRVIKEKVQKTTR